MCLVWTDELFAASGLPAERLTAARPLFNRMRTELLGGQYLDVLGQTLPEDDDPAAGVERARHVIRFKSAKYTIEHPLLIGGTLAGADDDLLATYSAFGLPLGEAFQLRDDVLGVFGDPDETGKPAGDDLREGKRTVLLAMTLAGGEPGAGRRRPPARRRPAARTPTAWRRCAASSRTPARWTRVERLVADLTGAGAGGARGGAGRGAGARGAGPARGRGHRPRALAALGQAVRWRGVRQVRGRTDHVVVVGAGPGRAVGRDAAGRRRPAGDRPGARGGAGRPRRQRVMAAPDGAGDYRFDTGPTVLTMPDLIADCFDAARRADGRLAGPAAGLAALPGGVRRRHRPRRPRRHRPDGGRGGRGLRPGRGGRVPAVRRVRLAALPLRDARLHRPQHRLAARPA